MTTKPKITFDVLVMMAINQCAGINLESARDCPQCGQRTTAVFVEGLCGMCYLKKGPGQVQ